MGIDITLISEVKDIKYNPENFKKHSLSRDFCNFIGRRHVVNHRPELDQIGDITNIDISCIYKMEEYPDEEEILMSLEMAENESEKQDLLNKFELML